jgi:hypothetical protein
MQGRYQRCSQQKDYSVKMQVPTLFLTATYSEPSLSSSGARYVLSKSSSFFSELARAIRISTLPTSASSFASAAWASAMLNACGADVVARAKRCVRRYHGAATPGLSSRSHRQMQMARPICWEENGRVGESGRTQRCLEHVTPRALVVAFTRRRHSRQGCGAARSGPMTQRPSACNKCFAYFDVLLPPSAASLVRNPPSHASIVFASIAPPEYDGLLSLNTTLQTSHVPFRAREAPSEPVDGFVSPQSTITPSTRLGELPVPFALSLHAQRLCSAVSTRNCALVCLGPMGT